MRVPHKMRELFFSLLESLHEKNVVLLLKNNRGKTEKTKKALFSFTTTAQTLLMVPAKYNESKLIKNKLVYNFNGINLLKVKSLFTAQLTIIAFF